MSWRRKQHPSVPIMFDDTGSTVTLDPGGWIHCSCGTDFPIGDNITAAANAWLNHTTTSSHHRKEAA